MSRTLTVVTLGCLALLGSMAPRADAQTQKMCIVSVSKDLCEGKLLGGTWTPTQCVGPKNVKCSTLSATNVDWPVPFKTSGLPCDEAKELDGNLRIRIALNVRKHAPLQSQGSFTGSFNLIGPSTGSGRIFGTLAAGTHRPVCQGKCGKECEKCYDASFNAATKIWTIGTEGIMTGQVTTGVFKGCRLQWSFQGRFTAKGDKSGPDPSVGSNPWNFCGNVEGVLECPCG